MQLFVLNLQQEALAANDERLEAAMWQYLPRIVTELAAVIYNTGHCIMIELEVAPCDTSHMKSLDVAIYNSAFIASDKLLQSFQTTRGHCYL